MMLINMVHKGLLVACLLAMLGTSADAVHGDQHVVLLPKFHSHTAAEKYDSALFTLRWSCQGDTRHGWRADDVQALLDEWRAEAARKPLGMTEAEACQVLEVSLAEDQELDDEMLKAAYRYQLFESTAQARIIYSIPHPTGRQIVSVAQCGTCLVDTYKSRPWRQPHRCDTVRICKMASMGYHLKYVIRICAFLQAPGAQVPPGQEPSRAGEVCGGAEGLRETPGGRCRGPGTPVLAPAAHLEGNDVAHDRPVKSS